MTGPREAQIIAFLDSVGWGGAICSLLAGDASNRRYLRLIRPGTGERAVLMDAPSDKGEDVRPFLRIAEYLTGIGLSAPRIFARGEDLGFLLLEDLGDSLFARVVPRHPEMEISLYSAATDLLVHLHDQAPPRLAPYDAATATDLAALAFDWYLPAATGTGDTGARAAFCTAMQAALTGLAPDCDVLIQRDYHAENLLWLPDRRGIARVGLLDFQDAMLGHRAYDLVSLLQDARRDVPGDVEANMLARYITATGQGADAFTAAYHCLGVQRNLRILGVFARLCVRDGKAHYVDLIPRVWIHLQRDLSHPAMAAVRDVLAPALPDPTPDLLNRIKDKCATAPVQ